MYFHAKLPDGTKSEQKFFSTAEPPDMEPARPDQKLRLGGMCLGSAWRVDFGMGGWEMNGCVQSVLGHESEWIYIYIYTYVYTYIYIYRYRYLCNNRDYSNYLHQLWEPLSSKSEMDAVCQYQLFIGARRPDQHGELKNDAAKQGLNIMKYPAATSAKLAKRDTKWPPSTVESWAVFRGGVL